MIEKKWGSRILTGTFIVIICFWWLWGILFAQYMDSSNYENRKLAERPKLTIDNYNSFPAEYEAYFNDNLPFRNNLIMINSSIDYFIFKRSTSKNVIIGDNGWLFYTSVEDGDPIGCYQGKNLFSEEELQTFAQNCIKIQKFLEKKGKEFVIFIAPNKERIYNEEMPSKYGKPTDMYRALQVIQYLRENTTVRVVYPYEELMEAKNRLPVNIWYKSDTHWNKIGAYIGATALLAELGIYMPDIMSDEITITAGRQYSGDLARFLNLSDILKKKDYEYKVKGYNDHGVKKLERDKYHADGADSRKIYVCRDSFAENMAKYIGSQFADSWLINRATYSYDDFEQMDPDIFVLERVERNIEELATFSIMN